VYYTAQAYWAHSKITKKLSAVNKFPGFSSKIQAVRAGLHFSNYRSKLEHFEEQINIFYLKKP
jgi:hypothetical protein